MDTPLINAIRANNEPLAHEILTNNPASIHERDGYEVLY